MKKILFFVSVLLLSGCAGSPLIEVGDARDVKDCQLLKTFSGPTSYKIWGTPYIGAFTCEAIEKAEKMGATHTHLTTVDTSISSTIVLEAYKCPPDHDAMKRNTEEE